MLSGFSRWFSNRAAKSVSPSSIIYGESGFGKIRRRAVKPAYRTHHLQDLWPPAWSIADAMVYQLNDPIMTAKSFEEIDLVEVIRDRLWVRPIQLHPLQGEDLSISGLEDRIHL
jgi:hypothetical protein